MSTVANWGAAIYTSLTTALALAFAFIPKLIGFLIILLVGWIVASALSKALTWLLKKIGFERMATRVGLTRLEQQMGVRMNTAEILGKVLYWFVFLIFLVSAFDSLGLTTVSTILTQVIAYIPNVFVAILVLFLGTLASTFVADLVRGATSSANVGNPNLFSNIARYAILGFAGLIALEQLQIAPALLNILFTAVVGAAALAFGLAFGLGGREAAQRMLNRTENTVNTAATQMQAQQTINQARSAADMPTEQYRNRQYAQQPYMPQQPYGTPPPYTQQ
jgi:small-conductance mechanosensitive channel